MTNEENPLDYFKNFTSDPADQIMSLQDIEEVIKFHEEELDVEDKRVEGTDEYPNYGDDFADMVYIARRLLDTMKTMEMERDEARRNYCWAMSNGEEHKALNIARSREWDCFKENTNV